MMVVNSWSECVGYARMELALRLQGYPVPIDASVAVIGSADRWMTAYNRGKQIGYGDYPTLHNILVDDARSILDKNMAVRIIN